MEDKNFHVKKARALLQLSLLPTACVRMCVLHKLKIAAAAEGKLKITGFFWNETVKTRWLLSNLE